MLEILKILCSIRLEKINPAKITGMVATIK